MQAVSSATNGNKADIVLETSGCTDMVEKMWGLTAFMGSVSLVGFYNRPLCNYDLDNLVLGKMDLRGVSGARQSLVPVTDLVTQGTLDLRPLITHEIEFENIEKAMPLYDQAKETRIKMLVRIGGENVQP